MSLTLKQRFAMFRFRRRARKKNCVGFRVSDVPLLLQKLERNGVPSIVLRWFDEVPRNPHDEQRFTKDVDLLIEGAGLETAIALAAEKPGPIRCDVYTDVGLRGSTYSGMPYYPPALAQDLLKSRISYDSAFYVPRPEMHFQSLTYHLVYHKGLDSGIPTGCPLPTGREPKRDYARSLVQAAEALGISLEHPLTLWGLHQQLKQLGWDMPLDLLARWPRQTAWHQWLLEQEKRALQTWVEALPQLMVYFIREDASERGLTETICEMLAEKFSILAREELSSTQIERVTRQVRGGDWVHYGKTTMIRPKTAVICYDFSPTPVETNQAKRRSNKNAYEFVENGNFFFKHEIREQLRRQVVGLRRMHAIHGSDNPYEAQHMLQAIYGVDATLMNQRFQSAVSALPAENSRRRVA